MRNPSPWYGLILLVCSGLLSAHLQADPIVSKAPTVRDYLDFRDANPCPSTGEQDGACPYWRIVWMCDRYEWLQTLQSQQPCNPLEDRYPWPR